MNGQSKQTMEKAKETMRPKTPGSLTLQYLRNLRRINATADMGLDITLSQFLNYLDVVKDGKDELEKEIYKNEPKRKDALPKITSHSSFYSDDDSWVPGCLKIPPQTREKLQKEKQRKERLEKRQEKERILQDLKRKRYVVPQKKAVLGETGITVVVHKAQGENKGDQVNDSKRAVSKSAELRPIIQIPTIPRAYSSRDSTTDEKKAPLVFPRIDSWIARRRQINDQITARTKNEEADLLKAYVNQRPPGMNVVKSKVKEGIDDGKVEKMKDVWNEKRKSVGNNKTSISSIDPGKVHFSQASTSQYSDSTLKIGRGGGGGGTHQKGPPSGTHKVPPYKRWHFSEDPGAVRIYLRYHDNKPEKYVDGIVGEQGVPLLPISKQGILKGMVYDKETKSIHPPLPAVLRLGRAGRRMSLINRLRKKKNSKKTLTVTHHKGGHKLKRQASKVRAAIMLGKISKMSRKTIK